MPLPDPDPHLTPYFDPARPAPPRRTPLWLLLAPARLRCAPWWLAVQPARRPAATVIVLTVAAVVTCAAGVAWLL